MREWTTNTRNRHRRRAYTKKVKRSSFCVRQNWCERSGDCEWEGSRATEWGINGLVIGLERGWDAVAGTSRLLTTAGTSPSHPGQLWFWPLDEICLHLNSVAYILPALSPPGLLGEEWKKKAWQAVTRQDCRVFNMKAEKVQFKYLPISGYALPFVRRCPQREQYHGCCFNLLSRT